MRLPKPTPEDEAALDLAIENSNAERAPIDVDRAAPMGAEFPNELREAVVNDLVHTMGAASDLKLSWQLESEPADLLASARSRRDAAGRLAKTIEALWPNSPPPQATDREAVGGRPVD